MVSLSGSLVLASAVAVPKDQFIARIPQKEMEEIRKRIPRIPTDGELAALKLGDWKHVVFKDTNFSYLVFAAYLNKQLDVWEASKLFLHAECKKHSYYGLYEHQLFLPDGTCDEEALSLLVQGKGSFFTKELILQALAGLPPEKTQFFSFELIKEDIPELLCNLGEFLYYYPFIFHNPIGTLTWLVPPPDMMQALLCKRFGQHATNPIPVLGFRDIEVLSNTKQRVVCIPFEGCSLPAKVHDAATTALGIYYHDAVFHLSVDSADVHKEAYVELAKIYRDKRLKELTLDREFPQYITTDMLYCSVGLDSMGYSLQDRFWVSMILLQLRLSADRLPVEELIVKTLDYITENEKRWKREYGIEVESLYDFIEYFGHSTFEGGSLEKWEAYLRAKSALPA